MRVLAHLPRYLLVRIIAYRIQANAFGDLDRKTVQFLEQVTKAWLASVRPEVSGPGRQDRSCHRCCRWDAG